MDICGINMGDVYSMCEMNGAGNLIGLWQKQCNFDSKGDINVYKSQIGYTVETASVTINV